MAQEHSIHGKPTAAGHKVRYTGHDRKVREATLEDVLPDGRVNLSFTDTNGQVQKHTAVPHSADGGPHTWAHLE